MGRPVAPIVPRVVAISPDDGSAIDLRSPALAALLSWLVPGLGQVYQRRFLKGWLFMAALVGTLLAGLWIGDGKVVYASWRPGFKRWAFLCQAGIGGAALPAMVQSALLNGPAGQPFANSTWFAPPLVPGQVVSGSYARRLADTEPGMSLDEFQPLLAPGRTRDGAPPDGMLQYRPATSQQLSLWHLQLGRFFDIGTLYTMLAGLLNLLVIYDAWAGPMRPTAEEDEEDEEQHKTPSSNGQKRGRWTVTGRGR